jgi:hypothetical protein
MKLSFGFILLICLLFFSVGNAQASLKGYTYSYDISQVEWQILNWTAAFRDTNTPGNPFILERMEYNRKAKKVMIYLKGGLNLASDDNLKKSLDGCTTLLKQRFPDFDSTEDLYISYKLTSSDGQNVTYKEYKEGSFNDVQGIGTSAQIDN